MFSHIIYVDQNNQLRRYKREHMTLNLRSLEPIIFLYFINFNFRVNYFDIKLISKNVIYTLHECSNVASSKYLPLYYVITKHIEKQKLCTSILYKNVCFYNHL